MKQEGSHPLGWYGGEQAHFLSSLRRKKINENAHGEAQMWNGKKGTKVKP